MPRFSSARSGPSKPELVNFRSSVIPVIVTDRVSKEIVAIYSIKNYTPRYNYTMEVKMKQAAHDRLTRVVASAKKLSDIVESWRDEDGEYQPERFPILGDPDDLEGLAIDLDSACDDTIEVADGIARGRMDSSDLSILLEWREDISDSMADLTVPNTEVASELKYSIEKLFDAISAASDALGGSLHGRRDFYVYVHKDQGGKVFYVGKGTGRRAWVKDRHPLWHKHVEEHLSGVYEVEIVRSGLTEHEAESAEAELMEQYPGQLVNWIQGGVEIGISANLEDGTITISGPSTSHDDAYFDALEKFHQMRNENNLAVERERENEKVDPEGAIVRYREAISRLVDYAQLCPREPGLKGKLMGPWVPSGVDLEPLDRLTILLFKQKRFSELIKEVDSLFEKFPDIIEGTVGQRIWKRRERASNLD